MGVRVVKVAARSVRDRAKPIKGMGGQRVETGRRMTTAVCNGWRWSHTLSVSLFSVSLFSVSLSSFSLHEGGHSWKK